MTSPSLDPQPASDGTDPHLDAHALSPEVTLRDLTTLRIGGRIHNYVPAHTEDEVIAAVRAADEAGEPLLVLGGGSNVVASDAPFAGTVVHLQDPGTPPILDDQCDITPPSDLEASTPADPAALTPLSATCGGAQVEYFAGVNWDRAVQYAVARHLVGVECLSGIPGTVGATPIQNVGAYGQDVSATISRVRTWDRAEQKVRTFFAADCQFSYRDSVFKRTRFPHDPAQPTGRYVVLAVTFHHGIGSLSAPVQYPELAAKLGVEVGQRAPLDQVREAVLAIRANKGMVLNKADHDTWSAGSFFTNPILPAEQAQQLPAEAPRFDAGPGQIKTSAAWLITHAGIERGFGINDRATVSTKHSLALTNRGNATSDDVVQLARAIQDRVEEAYGVRLVPEPVRCGIDL